MKFHNDDAITFTAPYNSEATEKFWGTLAKVFVKDQFALVKTTATTVAATSNLQPDLCISRSSQLKYIPLEQIEKIIMTSAE